jgi:hypothetical protein
VTPTRRLRHSYEEAAAYRNENAGLVAYLNRPRPATVDLLLERNVDHSKLGQ